MTNITLEVISAVVVGIIMVISWKLMKGMKD